MMPFQKVEIEKKPVRQTVCKSWIVSSTQFALTLQGKEKGKHFS